MLYVFQDDAEAPMLPPLYTSEFVLEPNQLLFSPDEEEFQDGLGEVIKGFQDTVLRVQNLVPDTYFDAFTRWAEFGIQCKISRYCLLHLHKCPRRIRHTYEWFKITHI